MSKVTSMDRLVVRNPVPQEVQSLDPILDVRSDQSGVTRTWMPRESSCECRDPKRREVRGRAQVPPESEVQFSDHLAVRLSSTPRSGPAPSGLDVLSSLGVLWEQLASPIPGGWPLLRRTMGDQGGIDGVPEHDLESPEVFVERSSDSDVPVVEPDPGFEVAVGRGEVRAASACREPVCNDGMIDCRHA